MAYKIDPITGQLIKNDSELATPTNKQWNSRDYVGSTVPGNGILDRVVPMQARMPAMEETQQQADYAGLRGMLKQVDPSSVVKEPPKRIEYKQGTPEYEKNVLAEGLEFDDEQDNQLQQLNSQIDDQNVNDNEKNALMEKYDQLHDTFRSTNKSRYHGGR